MIGANIYSTVFHKMESDFTVLFSDIGDRSLQAQTPAEIDIWLLDLHNIQPEKIPRLEKYLSADELARAKKIRHELDFVSTRAFVRLCIAQYLNTSPSELLFENAPAGKPYLSNSPLPFYFNLSHCENMVALGISKHTNIGVDIEKLKMRSFMDIAERYFNLDEFKQLQACDPAKQKLLFFTLWTLKEAFFKALGSGIVTGLDKVCFDLASEKITYKFAPELKLIESEWQFYHTSPAQDVHFSVACSSAAPLSLRWFNGAELFNHS
jgi:4'-phosphopantetheinyl transferase